jgi:hypothetical protein
MTIQVITRGRYRTGRNDPPDHLAEATKKIPSAPITEEMGDLVKCGEC